MYALKILPIEFDVAMAAHEDTNVIAAEMRTTDVGVANGATRQEADGVASIEFPE